MNELVLFEKDNKIVKKDFIERIVFNPTTDNLPYKVKQEVYKEKVLVIKFNDGDKISKIIVKDLATKRGNQTKEQLLNQRILEGKGHILIQENGENRIIRISNIIEVQTEWRDT